MRGRRAVWMMAVGVSMGLFVVLLGLMNLSFWREQRLEGERIFVDDRGIEAVRRCEIRVSYGGVAVGVGELFFDGQVRLHSDGGWKWGYQRYRKPLYPSAPDGAGGLGFQLIRLESPARTWHGVVMPVPVLLLLSAFLPVQLAIRWRRERRTKVEDLCRRCAYDMRASPERCPECGTEVARG